MRSATSQIEVIRGPSSSLYGNASGGVISVVSEGSGAEPFAQARLMSGSYGFQKLQFKTGGKTDRLDYLVSLSESELEGYRAQSAAENKQLTGRFDLDLGNDRDLLTVVNFTDQPVSDDAGGITAAANLISPDLREVWDGMNAGMDISEAQTRVNKQRHILEKYPPFPPTLKALLHRLHGFPKWSVKPPLESISSELEEKAFQELQAVA